MEETPKSQNYIDEPRAWRTGDFCRFPAGLVLCVGAGNLSAQLVTEGGVPLADIAIPGDTNVMHNTGSV